MSRGQNCGPKSCHEMAIEHVVHAMREAHNSDAPKVNHHLDLSRSYADMQARRLRAGGQGEAAEKYMQQHASHISAVRSILESRIKKSEDLAKGFPTTPSASTARKEYMGTGMVKPTMSVKKPGQDPRYDYRPIHLLHPEDQHAAQQKFGTKNIAHFHYPVDKANGRLVHGTRAPVQNSKEPLASAHSYQQLKPEHTMGTSVRVDAPGHNYHGKFGIVHGPNPYYPGKVAVQIGASEHEKIFVEPHQIKLSRPSSRIEKAVASVYAIRKALQLKKN